MKIITQAFQYQTSFGDEPKADNYKILIEPYNFYKIFDKKGIPNNTRFHYTIVRYYRFSNVNLLLKVITGDSDMYSVFVKLNWWQLQYILLTNRRHWFQQKDNIMWLVNIMVAILAVIVSYKVAMN